MGLFLRVRGRPLRPHVFRFDDSVERVVFGTDSSRCQVVFAPGVRAVAAQHAALERVLGSYRWVLNGHDDVFVDGVRVMEGDLLPDHGTVRLGARGPRLFFSHGENAEVPVLKPLGRMRAGLGRARDLAARVRVNRIAMIALALMLLVVTAAGAMAVQRGERGGSPDAEAKLRTVLREAAPSVYRVIRRSVNGHERGYGTAFVVAEDVLATNAHVANAFDELSLGETLIVRSTGDQPRTYEVVRTDVHPGHDEFERTWWSYGPEQSPDAYVFAPGGACDVALLHVEPAARLGRPLPLASDPHLASLHRGQPVGLVGYPSEGMVLDGSPLRQPVPHQQPGTLTSISTFFGDVDADGVNRLLQHSCPSTGGASGSPLLDATGHVVGVVHAGNMAGSWRGRIPLGVGVNFAQRVDLLRELIDGEAEAALAQHVASWRAQLRTLYTSTFERQRETWLERLFASRDWRTPTRPTGSRSPFSVVDAGVFDVLRPRESEEPTVQRMALPGDGCYALVVWSFGWVRADEIEVRTVGVQGALPPQPIERRDPRNIPMRAYDILVSGPGTLELTIAARRGRHARVEYELHRARADHPAAPAAPTKAVATETNVGRDEKLIEACKPHLARQLGAPVTLERVASIEQDKTGDGFHGLINWFKRIPVGQRGLYLVEFRILRGAELHRFSYSDTDLVPTRGNPHVATAMTYARGDASIFVSRTLFTDDAEDPLVLVRVYRVTIER